MDFKRIFASSILAIVLVAVTGGLAGPEKKTETINGYVVDSACAFIKNLKKPVSRECALACAKAGSPLLILGDDGNLYWPISDSTPATGQNARLLEFAGQKVRVKGKLYERGGSRAIVVEVIQRAPTRG